MPGDCYPGSSPRTVKDNGVRIQIDLWTNRIYQLVPGGQRELYTIQQAS